MTTPEYGVSRLILNLRLAKVALKKNTKLKLTVRVLDSGVRFKGLEHRLYGGLKIFRPYS